MLCDRPGLKPGSTVDVSPSGAGLQMVAVSRTARVRTIRGDAVAQSATVITAYNDAPDPGPSRRAIRESRDGLVIELLRLKPNTSIGSRIPRRTDLGVIDQIAQSVPGKVVRTLSHPPRQTLWLPQRPDRAGWRASRQPDLSWSGSDRRRSIVRAS